MTFGLFFRGSLANNDDGHELIK